MQIGSLLIWSLWFNIYTRPIPSSNRLSRYEQACFSVKPPTVFVTVGEEVRISVTFDKPVAVTGEQIYLTMNVTDDITDYSNRAFVLPEESSFLQLEFYIGLV